LQAYGGAGSGRMMGGPVMRRLRRGLAVAALVVAMGSLAAGCGHSGAIKNAISSLSPSRRLGAKSLVSTQLTK